VAAGDLNGDFNPDLFVTGDPSTGVDAWVLENVGGGATAAHVIQPVANIAPGSGRVTVSWTGDAGGAGAGGAAGSGEAGSGAAGGGVTVVRRDAGAARSVAPVVIGAPAALASGGCGVLDASAVAGLTYVYEVWSAYGAASARLLGSVTITVPGGL